MFSSLEEKDKEIVIAAMEEKKFKYNFNNLKILNFIKF